MSVDYHFEEDMEDLFEEICSDEILKDQIDSIVRDNWTKYNELKKKYNELDAKDDETAMWKALFF